MARYVEWKPFYSVGNESLDGQHQQVLAMINDLYEALGQGDSHEKMRALLDRLLQYANTHFAYEERLMCEAGYPSLEEHAEQHAALRRQTAGLRANSELVMGQDLLRFLKHWWIDHIQEEDQKYAPYVSTTVSS